MTFLAPSAFTFPRSNNLKAVQTKRDLIQAIEHAADAHCPYAEVLDTMKIPGYRAGTRRAVLGLWSSFMKGHQVASSVQKDGLTRPCIDLASLWGITLLYLSYQHELYAKLSISRLEAEIIRK